MDQAFITNTTSSVFTAEFVCGEDRIVVRVPPRAGTILTLPVGEWRCCVGKPHGVRVSFLRQVEGGEA